jgi:chromosome condensin MukBEF MukE localization factor
MIEQKEQMIEQFEEMLRTYKKELVKTPDSFFYIGLVKTTEDYIQELKNNN